MKNNTVFLTFDYINDYMTAVFRGLGIPEDEAGICADVLVTADRLGFDSHGINRLKPIYYDRIKLGIQHAITNFEIIREGPTTAVVDGHDGMGQVIGRRSMEMAIAKARQYGLGMVAVRNSTHYGIAGYYGIMATKEDMIGLTGTNARPSVAPTFGVENMLGTNPLTFGIPTDEEFPFLIDCATSLTQRGKVEVYQRQGKDVPPGWVIDQTGGTRTDTEQILKDLVLGTAALTPLGGIGEDGAGYKGYGYGTVVEILSAALAGGGFMKMLSGISDGKKIPYHLGHFFVAVDIAAFIDPAEFKKTAGSILRELRASKKMPGAERIYTAGEKEYLTWQKRKKTGVPVYLDVQKEMIAMRDELKLEMRLPFE